MRKRLPKILLCILLVALIVSNIYFISKFMEPSIHVQIGIPHFDENSDVSAMELSPVLNNKEDTNLILLTFMLGRPMEEAQFPTDPPHAYLVVSYAGCAYPYKLWLQENSVIFETSTESITEYRQFHNDHNNVVPLLEDLIESLKNSNFS